MPRLFRDSVREAVILSEDVEDDHLTDKFAVYPTGSIPVAKESDILCATQAFIRITHCRGHWEQHPWPYVPLGDIRVHHPTL